MSERRELREPGPYDDILAEAYETYGNIPPGLIEAMIQVESAGKPGAVSQKGARGLMQMMEGTAREMGVEDIHDPYQNIMGGKGNAFPWNLYPSYRGQRVQFCYDSSYIKATRNIRITRLRWKASDAAATWTGCTYSNTVITMSSCTVDHSLLPSNPNFAGNHGKDLTVVFLGTITVIQKAPAPTTTRRVKAG